MKTRPGIIDDAARGARRDAHLAVLHGACPKRPPHRADRHRQARVPKGDLYAFREATDRFATSELQLGPRRCLPQAKVSCLDRN
jgi:hypothetical protein